MSRKMIRSNKAIAWSFWELCAPPPAWTLQTQRIIAVIIRLAGRPSNGMIVMMMVTRIATVETTKNDHNPEHNKRTTTTTVTKMDAGPVLTAQSEEHQSLHSHTDSIREVLPWQQWWRKVVRQKGEIVMTASAGGTDNRRVAGQMRWLNCCSLLTMTMTNPKNAQPY